MKSFPIKNSFIFIIFYCIALFSFSQNMVLNPISQEERDKLTHLKEGTTILNTTTNCINYYANNQWFAICGNCQVAPPKIDSVIVKDNNVVIFLSYSENKTSFVINTIPTTITVEDSNHIIILKNMTFDTNYLLQIQAKKECGSSSIVEHSIKIKNNDGCKGLTTVTDNRNGKTYKVKSIDGDCWFTEDLIIEDKSNKNNVTEINTTKPNYYYTWKYANNTTQLPIYKPNYSANQGICPTGWHLPTGNEAWKLYLYTTSLNIQPLPIKIYDAYAFNNKQYIPSEFSLFWIGGISESGKQAFFIANNQTIKVVETDDNIGAFVRCVMNK